MARIKPVVKSISPTELLCQSSAAAIKISKNRKVQCILMAIPATRPNLNESHLFFFEYKAGKGKFWPCDHSHQAKRKWSPNKCLAQVFSGAIAEWYRAAQACAEHAYSLQTA